MFSELPVHDHIDKLVTKLDHIYSEVKQNTQKAAMKQKYEYNKKIQKDNVINFNVVKKC